MRSNTGPPEGPQRRLERTPRRLHRPRAHQNTSSSRGPRAAASRRGGRHQARSGPPVTWRKQGSDSAPGNRAARNDRGCRTRTPARRRECKRSRTPWSESAFRRPCSPERFPASKPSHGSVPAARAPPCNTSRVPWAPRNLPRRSRRPLGGAPSEPCGGPPGPKAAPSDQELSPRNHPHLEDAPPRLYAPAAATTPVQMLSPIAQGS
mmetsp:Transcript_34955/g.78750  ORF Transcript_34955/g.78750 Transcript_34955/m.78750 type:complete len:207 (-) Transcript_34955:287-907(-)